jgi:D-alanyl-D-alanine carboxypeptidase
MINVEKTSAMIALFGDPSVSTAAQAAFEKKWMGLVELPPDVRAAIPFLPKNLYTNCLIAFPLVDTLRALIAACVHTELKSYDGCFNVRVIRGTENSTKILSRHAVGLAVDFNADDMPRLSRSKWSKKFLSIWRENGWTCGADWKHAIDPMHFEMTTFVSSELETICESVKKIDDGKVK